jgi:hypothetical protein
MSRRFRAETLGTPGLEQHRPPMLSAECGVHARAVARQGEPTSGEVSAPVLTTTGRRLKYLRRLQVVSEGPLPLVQTRGA